MEAVDLANATCYGLSASVFSRDYERAKIKALKLEVGNVFINEIVASDPAIPGGGVKDSGYGRECFSDGLHETLNRKAIVVGN
jgi:succinate-semialdehyde dehydrogenase / glutarate-semialdehyde dehydrogenase